jgi:hypothetical protein
MVTTAEPEPHPEQEERLSEIIDIPESGLQLSSFAMTVS